MATSGTFTFNLNVEQIIEEAYEQIGIEYKTGEELRTARRTLNLLLLDWINDNVPLWSIDQFTVALTTATATYTLDAKYVDVLDVVIRDANGTDVNATRLSMSEYLNRPTKTTQGAPIQYTLERNATGGHTLYVWPVPPDNTYTFVAWGMRYIEDIGSDYTNDVEIPRRFLPALCAGLTYGLAKKKAKENPEYILPMLNILKADYKEAYEKAKDEDRERAPLYILPTNKPGRSR